MCLGTNDSAIKLIKNDRIHSTLKLDYPFVFDLQFDPSSSNFLVVSSWNLMKGCLEVWDVIKGKLEFKLHEGFISCFEFNHNGSLLATGSFDGFVRLFDCRAKKILLEWSVDEKTVGKVRGICWDGNETSIFVLVEKPNDIWTVSQFDVNKLNELQSISLEGRIKKSLKDKKKKITLVTNGKHHLGIGNFGLINLKKNEETLLEDYEVECFDFDDNRNDVVCASCMDGSVFVYNYL